MKKQLSAMAFLLLSLTVSWGQGKDLYQELVAQGNRYFEQEQYNLAIQLYRDALTFNVSDPLTDYRLAESHRHTFNYLEAESYYLKVLYSAQNSFPLSLYYYAVMLKLNGNHAEAMKRLDQFIAFHGNNALLQEYVEQALVEKAGCEIAQQESLRPNSVKAQFMGGDVNSVYNDFAPAFRDATHLVITSSRIESNRKLIDERNGEAFSDNYYFQKLANGWKDETRHQFSITNSVYHDGSGSFTKKGDVYLFTICEERCRIFETHIKDNKWTKPAALNEAINYPGFDSKQPAISPGGDTLYFASTRPGGYGLFDIWMSTDGGNNNWTEPVNAGKAINTKANDIAPSLTGLSSVIFFSSDGHPGYGGFDIFVAKAKSNGDTVLYNLNSPFNSVRDDCFVTFHGDEILWSSNRTGGKGGFDIYSSTNVSAIGLVSRLSLKDRNDSRSVTLTSRTASSENIQLLASRNEETIDYNNLTYERKAAVNKMVENRLNNIPNRYQDFTGMSRDEFETLDEMSHVRFQTILLREKYASTLLSEVVKDTDINGPLSITGQLVSVKTGMALNNARVLLTNEYGEILKITSTNEVGHFRFTGVPPDARLFLRLEKAGGINVDAYARNVYTLGSETGSTHYVENVYFDFDHYVIRPEAAQVLSELAAYLKSNPGVQVEIHAFADDRGGSAYNFELTQKRGEAVVAYLTRQGVDETSLAILPRGKEKINFGTNEIQRQFNRRAEFFINGVHGNITPLVKTYILKREADWNLISRITGVSKEELKSLNRCESDMIRAYQPVRLPVNAKTISEELFFVGI